MRAKHEQRPNQGVTPSRSPAFQFYADDWLAGTMGLSYEAKGFYIDLLALMWSRKGAIPLEQVATAFRLDRRMASRLINILIDAGKVSLDADNRVYNERMNLSLEVTSRRSRSAQSRAKVGAKSPELRGEVGAKSPENVPDMQENSMIDASIKNAPSPSPLEKKEESTNVLSSSALPSDVPVLEAFQAWNAMALRCGLPQASRLTPKRKSSIRARIREHGPDSWAIALANIERSAFLRGIDREWRANLDFLIQPSSFTKVFEGTYGNGAHAEPVVDPAQAAQSQALLEQALAELGEVH